MAFKPFSAQRLEPEYADAYQAWKQQPDKQTTGLLLKTLEPEINRGISAHVGASNPLLKSRARQLTLTALRNYDPQRAGLGTHIVNHLQGLKRVARQQNQILPVPERIAQQQAMLQQREIELTDELGREPSTAELSNRTGLSLAKIAKVRQYRPPVTESYFEGSPELEQSGYSPAVQHDSQMWLDVIYGDLGPTDQKIMEWSLGLHGQPQLRNAVIADRLGLSPGAISQRKARIQQLLDQEQELSPWPNQ